MPPILAFSSIVDATVSAPALIKGLFNRLPAGGHELVLFNINQVADIGPLLKWDPSEMYGVLQDNPGRTFTLSLVTNNSAESTDVMFVSQPHDQDEAVDIDLGMSWPDGVYSLTHVALPFPEDDLLYGDKDRAGESDSHIQLGDIALRGERGVLHVPAAEMLRLRWNPFYPFLEQKVMEFFTLETPGDSTAVMDQQL